jgi:Kef-type K+ transport system membrane component KefB
VAVLLIVLLVWVATHLGLDVLLGAFVAGLLVRVANRGEDSEIIAKKLSGIAFGFFVPLFFIVSGMRFDLNALTSDPSTFLRLPLFLGLFFVVRGIPVLLLYRRDVPRSQLLPMALLASTALPLVVAITEIGLQTGKMRPANAAALVGAGMLSVLLFPTTAFALRRRARVTPDDSMSPSVD